MSTFPLMSHCPTLRVFHSLLAFFITVSLDEFLRLHHSYETLVLSFPHESQSCEVSQCVIHGCECFPLLGKFLGWGIPVIWGLPIPSHISLWLHSALSPVLIVTGIESKLASVVFLHWVRDRVPAYFQLMHEHVKAHFLTLGFKVKHSKLWAFRGGCRSWGSACFSGWREISLHVTLAWPVKSLLPRVSESPPI